MDSGRNGELMEQADREWVAALAYDMVRREVMEPLTEFMDRLMGVLLTDPGQYEALCQQMLLAWKGVPEGRRGSWGDQLFARYAQLNHDLESESRGFREQQPASRPGESGARILEWPLGRQDDHE